MTVTVTAAFTSVDDQKARFRVGPSGCFGYFNSLSYLNLSDRTPANQWTQNFELLEFWPHMQVDAQYSEKIAEAIEAMNGFGPYKDLFVHSPANSIQANCREHEVDKIFTGFMTIRDFLYYGNGFANLKAHSEVPADGVRMGILLGMMGCSCDMFGRFTMSERSSSSEGTATYIPQSLDALALYMMMFGTKENCAQCWAQGKMGEENHSNGYVRNGRGELRNIRRIRGYSESYYSSMSHWLQGWMSVPTFLPDDLAAKRGRLTVRQFIDRIRGRLQGISGGAEQAAIIISLFEELKEMYD